MSDFGVPVELVRKVDAQEGLVAQEVPAQNAHHLAELLFVGVVAEPKFLDVLDGDVCL